MAKKKLDKLMDDYACVLYEIGFQLAQYGKEFTLDLDFGKVQFTFTHKPKAEE